MICYEEKDVENRKKGNRYFLIDPDWKSWEKNAKGHHQFPPFGQVKNRGKVEFLSNKQFPDVYRLIQHNKAIISKPGGATLIDSLSSATPIILLKPFGRYENSNALLWEYFGFGIPYQKWIDSECSLKVLEKLHTNLLKARERIQDYVEFYCAT